MIDPPPTLVAFLPSLDCPPSLDCELARLLLGHYAIPYVEERHTLVFSFLATCWRGRTLRFPLLDKPAAPVLDTVRKMIDWFDPLAPPGTRPFGDGSDRAAIEADRWLFNATLGGATAAFACFRAARS